jgi:hypothetical protein
MCEEDVLGSMCDGDVFGSEIDDDNDGNNAADEESGMPLLLLLKPMVGLLSAKGLWE